MNHLKLFGIPFDKAINLIGNAHILLIVSLAVSLVFDFNYLGTSHIVELDLPATGTSIHFLGFVLWQIIHLLLGKVFLSSVNPRNYGLLSLCEMVQGYFTIVYFWNPLVRMYWNASRSFLVIFKYTAITETYVVYIFLSLSTISSILLMFSHEQSEAKKTSKGTILGVSYEICEAIIYWINFVTFIPTVLAFLCDCLIIINFAYFRAPSQHQMMVSSCYALMIIYQYARYLSLLFPNLQRISFRSFLEEIVQLIAFLMFYFNPWRPVDKVILDYFHYTVLAQKLAIPLLLISLAMNSVIYYVISRHPQRDSIGPKDKKKSSTRKEKNWPKRRGAIRRRRRT